jgi:hypothetical protein
MKIRLMMVAAITAGLFTGHAVAQGTGAAAGAGAKPAQTTPRAQGEASVMPPAVSVRSRAEVLAECLSAQKAGTIPQGECPEYGKQTAAGKPTTRAEVLAECRVAQKAGLIPQGECPEYGTPAGATKR